MDKITKLPWKIKKIFPEGLSYFYDADNNILFRVKIKEDAEYICRAVNSHEGLVEAAKDVLFAYIAHSDLKASPLDDGMRKLKKALKAADGEGV